MKGTFMIVAKCDPYHAKFHWHGEKVLKYDGATPVWWVHKDGLTKEEALEEFRGWALEEGFDWDEDSIAVFCGDEGITPEQFEKDNPWYVGPGFYDGGNNELLYAYGDEVYHDDDMTYVIKEMDMELRENTEIYKEIYKKSEEVTDQERAIIESVGGTIQERKTDDYHAFAFNINQQSSTGEDVGESLVELLNNLANYNDHECLWYLGDIDQEYVFLD